MGESNNTELYGLDEVEANEPVELDETDEGIDTSEPDGTCDTEEAWEDAEPETEEMENEPQPAEKVKLGGLGKILIAIMSVALVLAIAVMIYSFDYYRADVRAEAMMADGNTVGQYTVFDGGGDIGLIFYPGGKVEHSAYAPLMKRLADNGISCVLVEMPMKLAFLDTDAWRGAMKYAPNVEKWYIGGHSLGGAIAASSLREDEISGLILLASYAAGDVNVPTLLVSAELDGVIDKEKYESGKEYLNAGYNECVINGGNHAGFGSYGVQDGDGTAEITADEQLYLTALEIMKFCK